MSKRRLCVVCLAAYAAAGQAKCVDCDAKHNNRIAKATPYPPLTDLEHQ